MQLGIITEEDWFNKQSAPDMDYKTREEVQLDWMLIESNKVSLRYY